MSKIIFVYVLNLLIMKSNSDYLLIELDEDSKRLSSGEFEFGKAMNLIKF